MMMPITPPLTNMKQAGFSMVELMVALVLGLFITVAVLQTFMGAKQAYEFQQEFSRIQENGRFAMEFLTKDIRQADFWGCLNDGVNVQSMLFSDTDSDVFAAGLAGSDAVPSSISGYAPDLGPLADAIVLQGGRGTDISTVKPFPVGTQASIKLIGADSIKVGDVLLVSDCLRGVKFEVTSISAVPSEPSQRNLTHGASGVLGNQPLPGSSDYGLGILQDNAKVFEASDIRYWLRKNVESGEPTLVRGTSLDPWSGGEELIEGVENLQILYGVDTSGNLTPNYFVPADQVADMGAVVSVQIHLLIRSLRDNMLDEPQAIDYYGQSRVNVDRHLRKAFTSTIAIRNRLD